METTKKQIKWMASGITKWCDSSSFIDTAAFASPAISLPRA